MFATKSAIFIAILALFNVVAAAVPPGCLLGAINTQDDPSDLKAICGSDSDKVQREIVKACDDDDTSKALKAFAKSCSEAGEKVSIISVETLKPSATGAGKYTATGTASPTDADSASTITEGSAQPSKTGSSAHAHNADTFVVAAVVAMVGLAAAI